MLKIRGRVITHKSQFVGLTPAEKRMAREYIAEHALAIRTFLFIMSEDKKKVTVTDKKLTLELPTNDTLYNAIFKHPTYPVVIYECWLVGAQLTLSRQIT